MPSLHSFVDLPALALLIVANTTPVIVALFLRERYAAPLDAGFVLRDGRPLFGAHKTWRGLIAGILACALAGATLSAGTLVGAAFGALALAGDLASSFVKRRLDRPSGRWTPLLDQLPEAVLPLLLLSRSLGLTYASILGTTAVFTLLDLVASRRLSVHKPNMR